MLLYSHKLFKCHCGTQDRVYNEHISYYKHHVQEKKVWYSLEAELLVQLELE